MEWLLEAQVSRKSAPLGCPWCMVLNERSLRRIMEYHYFCNFYILCISLSICLICLIMGARPLIVQWIEDFGAMLYSVLWYGCNVSGLLDAVLPNLFFWWWLQRFPPLSFSAGLLCMFRPHCVSWELPAGSGCVCTAVRSWLPLECFPQILEFLGVSTCVLRCVAYELCGLLLWDESLELWAQSVEWLLCSNPK